MGFANVVYRLFVLFFLSTHYDVTTFTFGEYYRDQWLE